MPSRGLLGPRICYFPLVHSIPHSPIWFYSFSSHFKHPAPLSTSLLSALTLLAVSWREQKLTDEHSCELPSRIPMTCLDSYPPGPVFFCIAVPPVHCAWSHSSLSHGLGHHQSCCHPRGGCCSAVSGIIKEWLWICSNSFFKIPHIYITRKMFLPKLLKRNLIKPLDLISNII